MNIWTNEEEAENLKARFAGLNRAAFARDYDLKGGQALIYQHINGIRKISREAALSYARGFGVRLEEISPRLAKEASDDLMQIIRPIIKGVEWVIDNKNATTIVIERIKSDEKTLPEKIQTITYAQHEVNFVSAMLLMPNNASYLYDIASGGSEIEFGYVVTATKNGKQIFDELVRGNVSSEYSRCQNQRIQNVFGGVSSAGFIANNDMQYRCIDRDQNSLENLRNEVLVSVANAILKISTIKDIQNFY